MQSPARAHCDPRTDPPPPYTHTPPPRTRPLPNPFLPQAYYNVFTHGLVMVANQTRAWIIDGGMDAGVMKLMGDTKSRHQVRCSTSERSMSEA
jgi:hypothetical protein